MKRNDLALCCRHKVIIMKGLDSMSKCSETRRTNGFDAIAACLYIPSIRSKSTGRLNLRVRGYTLIELLLIVTIIGILASIIVMNLGGAAGKANRSAFVDEVTGSLPWLLTKCANENISSIPLTPNVNWTDPDSSHEDCGLGTSRTFCVKATNKNAFAKTSIGACNVYINQGGVLYNDSSCSATLFSSSHCE
jgi:type II secretory pathway pseudopilin PulG